MKKHTQINLHFMTQQTEFQKLSKFGKVIKN